MGEAKRTSRWRATVAAPKDPDPPFRIDAALEVHGQWFRVAAVNSYRVVLERVTDPAWIARIRAEQDRQAAGAQGAPVAADMPAPSPPWQHPEAAMDGTTR